MTFEDLLKACSNGKMPHVQYVGNNKITTGSIGQVTTIKDNGRHKRGI